MGSFLNSRIPYEKYREIAEDTYFVDKTLLIDELIPVLGRANRFYCITRPRRFGKSVMANMVAAFFEKSDEGSELFHTLQISKSKQFQPHLNSHNVIYIDFSKMPENCEDYKSYIMRISDGIKEDLRQAFPELSMNDQQSLWDIFNSIFENKREKFIFVMDEWDAVFHMSFVTLDMQKTFLLFLKNLLKDQPYVEFAYMTGVLPIAKYSSGSELNMFLEYGMATTARFSEYYGFSDQEVDTLYNIYLEKNQYARISREDLRQWYDGYHTAAGDRLYNPRSIVCALTDNQLKNYWTSSGPYDEIFYYVRHNISDIRNDLVLMVAGEGVRASVQDYAAVSPELQSKDEIYSAMVVYGLLTYDDAYGKVFIPNRELMDQFKKMLMTKDSLGYVYRLAKKSEQMLEATLAGDTQTMIEILSYAHDTETPILSYNNEIELSAIVNLVYLAARDMYRVEREDKAGKGYVDFIFYPERKGADAIILELKVDDTPENAIKQIKDKNYRLRLDGKLGEKAKYTGRILAVGISYNKDTKQHACKIEILS